MSSDDARDARDAAIAQVHAHNVAWIENHALPAIRRMRGAFSTDDLWRVIDVAPPEPRAMGAALVQARRLGWISPTADYRPSARVECHARPVRIWQRKPEDAGQLAMFA